jgi:tetratricopeptide (TPR) repeat protein
MKKLEKAKSGLFCLLLVLAVFVLLTACSSKAATATDKIELGQKYLTELNYTEAVTSFTEAIKLDPDNIQAYMDRAEAYMALGEYDKALADYRFISGTTEDMPYTRALSYIGQAEVYEKIDKQDRALADYGLAKVLLTASDVGKAESVSEDDIKIKLVEALYAHAMLSEKIKSYDQALEDYDELQELGEKVESKRDEVLSQLGETAENENGLTDTEEPAAESTAEKPMEEPTEESAPEQEAASESESQSAKEEPTSSSEQAAEAEEAASSQEEEQPEEQKTQTYTAERIEPWSNEFQSGTTTVIDKVTYQIGGNTIVLHHTENKIWTNNANYGDPGQHTMRTTATDTYTLSEPLQGIERKGQWAVIWDVPAGTVVSLSGIKTEVCDGEMSYSWNRNSLGWLEPSHFLSQDEVFELNVGVAHDGGRSDTMTVEKGKLYELVEDTMENFFTPDGGFVFRGV